MRHLTGEFFKHKYCREFFETSGLNPVWWSELKLLIGVPFLAGSDVIKKPQRHFRTYGNCVLTGCLRIRQKSIRIRGTSRKKGDREEK